MSAIIRSRAQRTTQTKKPTSSRRCYQPGVQSGGILHWCIIHPGPRYLVSASLGMDSTVGNMRLRKGGTARKTKMVATDGDLDEETMSQEGMSWLNGHAYDLGDGCVVVCFMA